MFSLSPICCTVYSCDTLWLSVLLYIWERPSVSPSHGISSLTQIPYDHLPTLTWTTSSGNVLTIIKMKMKQSEYHFFFFFFFLGKRRKVGEQWELVYQWIWDTWNQLKLNRIELLFWKATWTLGRCVKLSGVNILNHNIHSKCINYIYIIMVKSHNYWGDYNKANTVAQSVFVYMHICVYVKQRQREKQRVWEERNLTGFIIITLQIAMVSAQPSNPAGFAPSGVRVRCNISHCGVWIPGNDDYRPQLCTILAVACSSHICALDVSQAP